MFELSKERLSELAKKLNIWNYEAIGSGSMSLELGTGDGSKTDLPRLYFNQSKKNSTFNVIIESDTSGYLSNREITLEEMVLFVRVAKKSAPNLWLTKKLTQVVSKRLLEKQKEIKLAQKLIT